MDLQAAGEEVERIGKQTVGRHNDRRQWLASPLAPANEERPLPLSCQVMDNDKCYLNKRRRAVGFAAGRSCALAPTEGGICLSRSNISLRCIKAPLPHRAAIR